MKLFTESKALKVLETFTDDVKQIGEYIRQRFVKKHNEEHNNENIIKNFFIKIRHLSFIIL